MRTTKLINRIGLVALLGILSLFAAGCSDKDGAMGDEVVGQGTLSGVVTDDLHQPLSGVTVTDISSAKSTSTSTDGSFTLSDIALHSEGQIVTFEKSGYETTSITLVPSKFAKGIATANVEMIFANAVIKGYLTDARNNNQPLAGAEVSVSAANKAVSDAQGYYEITGLALRDYTLTIIKEGYPTLTATIAAGAFVDGVATFDARLGSTELLRGITVEDLRNAPKWYNNEFKGGRNADAYPMFDWACDYMGSISTWTGDYEEQNEGSTLRIRNGESDQSNPADDKNFDTFVYGRKLITADNSKFTIQLRTHQSPCYWGVQIVDLTKAEPTLEYVGDIRVADSGSYYSEFFDLSPWEGKEVAVIVGHYRMESGDYWRQLVLRRFSFSNEYFANEVYTWMPGTEIADLPGWHMTESMVRSSMPQDLTHYTGISPVGGNRDNYIDAYQSWHGAGHVMAYWTHMPLHKDPDVFANEGYMIKTRGGEPADTKEPEQYVYAKYSIAPGHNKLTLTTRNFGDNYTFFKLTAITMDCKAHFMDPSENDALEASAAEDGCWKFKSGDDYCHFTYDLSEFDGQDVMICISVHNGEVNGDENKLTLNAIDIE